MHWKIYYNPKCGTCRNVLEMLESEGIKPEVIEYLKNPPSVKELDAILVKAGLLPEQIIRKKEDLYTKLDLANKKYNRSEWLKILSDNPVLIERPIVVKGDRAVVARPPESVQTLINS